MYLGGEKLLNSMSRVTKVMFPTCEKILKLGINYW